jgi:hypothetical protein
MDMQTIDNSTNIQAIGYDPAERRLRVVFKNSGTYDYEDVPPETHHALMKADSVGKHFCAHIKPQFKASKSTVAFE